MKYLVLAFIFATLWSCQPKSELLVLESPSGKLKVVVTTNEEKKVFYQVINKTDSAETVVVAKSPLGLVRSDADFTANLSLESESEPKLVSDTYTMVSGKQINLSYSAKEATLNFTNEAHQQMQIVFRIFDEGVAFRYVFPGQSDEKLSVESEITGFAIPAEVSAWMSPYQSAKPWGDPGYEADYLAVKSGTASPEKVGWAFPLLFNVDKNWIFISESGLGANYCGTHLKQDCSGGLYTISLPEADERYGDGDVKSSSALPWEMPWRFILVGQSLNEIVESSMVHHLAEPSKIEDTSWIIPGRASWEWYSSKGGRTVKALNHFVDLAAEMGWEYSLIDAGWENMPDGKIEDVVAHAKTKNVGLLFWYNSGGRRDSTMKNGDFLMFNDDTRDQEMARIAALGVKGIKVDFFATDKQLAIELYHKILTNAANHRLLVNFHGCTLPRGWSRTYPHLLSMEAVRGEECYRFSKPYPDLAPSYNTLAAIIRSTVGPADYTPAAFSNQKFPHKTTSANELALAMLYENGIIHMADTPENYRALPAEAKEFLKQVPAAWDETKLIAAVPGELFVIARRKGEKWYVAGINGKDEKQEIQINLPAKLESPTFIGDGEQPAELTAFKIPSSINSFSLTMLPNGGFVLY